MFLRVTTPFPDLLARADASRGARRLSSVRHIADLYDRYADEIERAEDDQLEQIPERVRARRPVFEQHRGGREDRVGERERRQHQQRRDERERPGREPADDPEQRNPLEDRCDHLGDEEEGECSARGR